MRIAALAFGVVAGLVASLILALGGLDAAALAGDARQLSLIRFGLFIIANFGVLGAGVVLASPLAGTILFVLGAIAWFAAALVLRHGPDYVMLVPPGLLLVSTVFAVIAHLRSPSRDYDEYDDEPALATQREAMNAARSEPTGEEDGPGRVAVGASFFGDGGTATPMRGAMADRQSDSSMGRGPDDDWQPVRRRTEPPRQKPMFRAVEDDEYDDEPGFWRASRITSSILSFGLYGALVAAAVLIFLNLRTAETRPAVAKIEASRPAKGVSSTPSPRVAVVPALPKPASSAEIVAAAPARVTPSIAPPSAPAEPTASAVVADANDPTAPAAPTAPASPGPAAPSSAELSSSSAEPPPDNTAPTAATTSTPFPFEMSPQMAAARSKPAPRQPAASTSQGDAGL